MAFEPTSWKCRVGAELEGCEFRLWSDLSDFWPKSPDTVRPNADLSDQSRTLSRSRRTPSRSTTLKITQQCVEVVSRLCYLTESLNSGDSLKESDFGRTVSGLLGQKSERSAFGRTVSGLLGQKSESSYIEGGTNPAPLGPRKSPPDLARSQSPRGG